MIKCQNKSHNKLFIVADEKRDLRIKGCLQGPQAGGCPSGGMPKRGLPPPPINFHNIYGTRIWPFVLGLGNFVHQYNNKN